MALFFFRMIAKEFKQFKQTTISRISQLKTKRQSEQEMFEDIATLVALLQDYIHTRSVNLIQMNKLINSEIDMPAKLNLIVNAHLQPTKQLIKLYNKLIFSAWQVLELTSESTRYFQDSAELFSACMNNYYLLEQARASSLEPFSITKFNINVIENNPNLIHKKKILKSFTFPDEEIFLPKNDFIPTVKALEYIQDRIDINDSPIQLQSLYTNMHHTYQEIAFTLLQQIDSDDLSNDYLNFPPFDIVREIPRYIECNNFISNNIDKLRTNLAEFTIQLKQTVRQFGQSYQTMKNCFFLSQINHQEIINLITENVKTSVLLEKIIFQKSVIDSIALTNDHSDLHIFTYYSHFSDTFQKFIQSNNNSISYDNISKLISELNAYHLNEANLFQSDQDALRKDIEEIQKQIADLDKKTQEENFAPNDQLDSERARILRLSNELSYKQQKLSTNLQNSIATYLKSTHVIQQSIEDPSFAMCEFLPLQIEELLSNMSDKCSTWLWLNKRIEYQNQITQQRTEIAKQKDEKLSIITNQINSKKQILEKYRERAEKKQNKRKFSNRKEYFCSSCSKRPKQVILKCGHLMCEKCANKSNGKCPFCKEIFVQKDIHKISWN